MDGASAPAAGGSEAADWKIGVDIGGTFIDFCALNTRAGRIASLKVLTTPEEPGAELMTGLALLAGQGRVAALNRPYAGGYVLDRHGAPRRGIHALQLEVCRSAYLDPQLTEPSARFPAMVRVLASFTRALAAETARLGSGGRLPLAAE